MLRILHTGAVYAHSLTLRVIINHCAVVLIYIFIINKQMLALQLLTNPSSVRIILKHTAWLDRCKRQRDTLRQNVETIPEGPLVN